MRESTPGTAPTPAPEARRVDNLERFDLQTKERARMKMILLAAELQTSGETFPFPGLTDNAYAQLLELSEDKFSEATPIDQLIKKFNSGNMKVVLTENKQVYLVPATSANTEDAVWRDSLLPAQLQTNSAMNPKLRDLILCGKILRTYPRSFCQTQKDEIVDRF